MRMVGLPTPSLTEEEYLALDRQAEFKSEFYDGQMFAMAGGSFNHALLANKIGAILYRQVSRECRVFNADLRIHIPAFRSYVYADCSVICGEPQFSGEKNVLNPLLVVEVLSPSSESYDRGKKCELYRALPNFREYLLVHQDRLRVEHFSRQADGSWVMRECLGGDARVNTEDLNVRVGLSELYASAINLIKPSAC